MVVKDFKGKGSIYIRRNEMCLYLFETMLIIKDDSSSLVYV